LKKQTTFITTSITTQLVSRLINKYWHGVIKIVFEKVCGQRTSRVESEGFPKDNEMSTFQLF